MGYGEIFHKAEVSEMYHNKVVGINRNNDSNREMKPLVNG